jgi:hypothetical protein
VEHLHAARPDAVTANAAPASPAAPGGVTQVTVRATPPAHRSAFHELLSELNPLQYIPVIGTIYRAVTGDVIPESSRSVGSLVVSFLTGGPVGVATNAAAQAAEKITGIDPEAIGQNLLADIGIGPHTAGQTPTAASAPAPAPASTHIVAPPPAERAWTASELSAYGVTTAHGKLMRGALAGSDVLNELELSRHTAGSA